MGLCDQKATFKGTIALTVCGVTAALMLSQCVRADDKAPSAKDGSVLPFPPQQMDSVVKPTLQDSTMKWPAEPQRLPDDAPNILIVLLDDSGFGSRKFLEGKSKHRRSRSWPPKACVTTCFIRPRFVRPRVRRC